MMNDNESLTIEEEGRGYPLVIEQAFESVARMRGGHEAWEHAKVLQKIYESYRNYHESLRALKDADFESVFLKNALSGVAYGQAVHSIIRKWGQGDAPSLAAIALKACDFFRVSEKDQRIIAVAAAMGSVENPLAFHNAAHTRKVLLQMIRLIRASFDISPHDIAKLLIAVCIQDIGHDGKGNTVDGKHIPMRLEMQAMQLSMRYMEAAGLSAQDFKEITLMVCGTDVTPIGSYKAPARMVAGDPQKLPDMFYIAKKDAQLLRMTRMMAIADVASATAMCAEMSFAERKALSEELKLQSIVTIDSFERFMQAVEPMFRSLPETIFVYGDAPVHVQREARQYFIKGTEVQATQRLSLVDDEG